MRSPNVNSTGGRGLRQTLLAVLSFLAVCVCAFLLQGCETTEHGSEAGGIPHGGRMSCGSGVELCGVLSLETGLGKGHYHHSEPVVHGLWPQTGHYGNSKCVRPDTNRDPKRLHSCYHQRGQSEKQLEDFQDHEWSKHGVCAGVDDAADYFSQVCGLSAAPLRVMKDARSDGHGLNGITGALQGAGYAVWDVDKKDSEVYLSACAGPDGKWKLAAVRDFRQACAGGGGTGGGGGAVCELGRRGPPCQSNGDCTGHGCLRCAKSGYCTAEPTSFLQKNGSHKRR